MNEADMIIFKLKHKNFIFKDREEFRGMLPLLCRIGAVEMRGIIEFGEGGVLVRFAVVSGPVGYESEEESQIHSNGDTDPTVGHVGCFNDIFSKDDSILLELECVNATK